MLWGCWWQRSGRCWAGAGVAMTLSVGASHAGHKGPIVPAGGGWPDRAGSGSLSMRMTAAPGSSAPRDTTAPTAGTAWQPLPSHLCFQPPAARHGGGYGPSPQLPVRPREPQPHPGPLRAPGQPPRRCCLPEAEQPLDHPAPGRREAPLAAAVGPGPRHANPALAPAGGGPGAPATRQL